MYFEALLCYSNDHNYDKLALSYHAAIENKIHNRPNQPSATSTTTRTNPLIVYSNNSFQIILVVRSKLMLDFIG